MVLANSSDGRFVGQGSGAGRDSDFLTFEMVEERLVEAMRLCWRLPDRERGWHRIRAYWPEMRRHHHFGDYADLHEADARPRPLPLGRRDIARMDEALGWLDGVPPVDRKLIGLVLTCLASGRSQVPWRELLAPMGKARGADGLRMRYERAMRKVVEGVNWQKSPVCSPSIP